MSVAIVLRLLLLACVACTSGTFSGSQFEIPASYAGEVAPTRLRRRASSSSSGVINSPLALPLSFTGEEQDAGGDLYVGTPVGENNPSESPYSDNTESDRFTYETGGAQGNAAEGLQRSGRQNAVPAPAGTVPLTVDGSDPKANFSVAFSLAIDLDDRTSSIDSESSAGHMEATFHLDHDSLLELQALFRGTSYWTEWGVWSACTVSCGGGGVRTRHRMCVLQESVMCTGAEVETSACPIARRCPSGSTSEQSVNRSGHWAGWSMWSACSVTCGQGIERQSRVCQGHLEGTESGCGGTHRRHRHCIWQACRREELSTQGDVLEGHHARLHCNYDHTQPVSNMYWVTPQGTTVLPEHVNNRYHMEGNYLYIHHAEDYDTGAYHCVVTRRDGHTDSSDADLAVVSCDTHNFCHNGGHCVEMAETPERPYKSVSCECLSGFSGTFCEAHSKRPLYVALTAVFFSLSVILTTAFIAYQSKDRVFGPRPSRQYQRLTPDEGDDFPPEFENDANPLGWSPDDLNLNLYENEDDRLVHFKAKSPASFAELARRTLPAVPAPSVREYTRTPLGRIQERRSLPAVPAPSVREYTRTPLGRIQERQPLLEGECDSAYMLLRDPLDHTYMEPEETFQYSEVRLPPDQSAPQPSSMGTSTRVQGGWSTSTPNPSPPASPQMGAAVYPQHIPRIPPPPLWKPTSPRRSRDYENIDWQQESPRAVNGENMRRDSVQDHPKTAGAVSDPEQQVYMEMGGTGGSQHQQTIGDEQSISQHPWSPRKYEWVPFNNSDWTAMQQRIPAQNKRQNVSPWRPPHGPHSSDEHVTLHAASEVVQGTPPSQHVSAMRGALAGSAMQSGPVQDPSAAPLPSHNTAQAASAAPSAPTPTREQLTSNVTGPRPSSVASGSGHYESLQQVRELRPTPSPVVVETMQAIVDNRTRLISHYPTGAPPGSPSNMTYRQMGELQVNAWVRSQQDHDPLKERAYIGLAEADAPGPVLTQPTTSGNSAVGESRQYRAGIPAGGLRTPASPLGSPRKKLFEDDFSTEPQHTSIQNINNHNTSRTVYESDSYIESHRPATAGGSTGTFPSEEYTRTVSSITDEETKDALLSLWVEALHSLPD